MKYSLGLVLIAFLICSGCFGSLDLDQRAFVVAIAFDQPEEGEGIKVTIQTPIPRLMRPGEGGGEEKPFVLLSVTEKTIGEAFTQLQRQLDRDMFIGHTHLLLFGDKLARKKGIEGVLDIFKRDFRVQRITQLAVVQGEASGILELQPTLEQDPSTFIENVLSKRGGSSLDVTTDLGKYLVVVADEGYEPVLPRLFKKGDSIATGGMAVIKEGKMVGWLSPRETRGYTILVNEYDRGRYEIPSPTIPGEIIVVRVRQAESRHRVKLLGDTLQIRTEITGGFETLEFTGPQGPSAKLESELAQAVSKEVAREVRAAIDRAQQLNSDIFGYGRLVRGLYPEYWAKINWSEVFPTLDIKFSAKTKWTQTVRRPGR
jgi:spore germination protein KC